MIIFGTTGIKSTIKEGSFHCPQCAAEKRYRHRKVNKFFTLYFIPVIPLGSAGEYVECRSCKGTFVPRVLDMARNQPNLDVQSEYEKAIKHSMVLMMLADGEIDDQEMAMVHIIVNKFSHNKMSLTQLEQYVESVQKNPEDISTYLTKVTPLLNDHGKEMILKCAFAVAASDGHVDPSELKLIEKMARIMRMSGAQLKNIVNGLSEPQRARAVAS